MNRLEELCAELAKVFGRLTKWQVRCLEQNARTESEQIQVAEQVLAEPCTGTVHEGYSWWIPLKKLERGES